MEKHTLTIAAPQGLQAAVAARKVPWTKVLELVVEYGKAVFPIVEAVLPLLSGPTPDWAGIAKLLIQYNPAIVKAVLGLFGITI